MLEYEKFFEDYYPNPQISDDAEILTDQFSPVNNLNEQKEESTTQVYQEIKNDNNSPRFFSAGFTAWDLLVQTTLILGVVIWSYILQKTWKKEETYLI